jgi:hypothetical protein
MEVRRSRGRESVEGKEGGKRAEGKERKRRHTLLPKGFKPALILSPPTKAVQSI